MSFTRTTSLTNTSVSILTLSELSCAFCNVMSCYLTAVISPWNPWRSLCISSFSLSRIRTPSSSARFSPSSSEILSWKVDRVASSCDFSDEFYYSKSLMIFLK
jgi:hypothetical protein